VANIDEISFYQLETEKENFSAKKFIGNYKISKSWGVNAPCTLLPTSMQYVTGKMLENCFQLNFKLEEG